MRSGAQTNPEQDPPGLASAAGDPSGRALGIVRPIAANAQGASHANPNGAGNGQGNDGGLVEGAKPGSTTSATANLAYHSGPVMGTGNTTYAIYWDPTGSGFAPNYTSLINRFFVDVAAATALPSSNTTYYSDTQYSGSSGAKISAKSTFGGSALDTALFPASGCTDTITDTLICLSDAQLASEIASVASSKGWPAGPTTLFFIFTPKGVGSCSGTSCAYSHFCAYHSWAGAGSSALLYAVQPYAAHAGCDGGVRPNANDADPAINVVSHEHNEAITDPQGSAWYDRQGYENADKCAWKFGSALGGSGVGLYNQVLNGNNYYLQQNWSNATSRCVSSGL
jgi:hypothetical protein